jgi:hypothetical protein
MKDRLLATKAYPSDYPADAVKILDTMSMDGDLILVGSMALRSQQYAGDYDGYEVVEKKGEVASVLSDLRQRFQSVLKNLRGLPNVYIGDIKAGVVEAWRILPTSARVKGDKIEGYNSVACRRRVDDLLRSRIITEHEAKEAMGLLKESPTICDFLLAKQNLKFHILRWTVAEVMANRKVMRDGKAITLEEAFHTRGITKMDVMGLVQGNRFTDFSVIYEFRCNGKVLNGEPIDIKNSLEESLIAYLCEGNYFKAIKRLFALAKYHNYLPMVRSLTPILNSDLGRLYQIVGDMDTLLRLMEENKKVPMSMIRFEIDQFIGRLSNIYSLEGYLKKDDAVVGEVRRILRLPDGRVREALEHLRDELDDVLQKASKPYVEHLKKGERLESLFK